MEENWDSEEEVEVEEMGDGEGQAEVEEMGDGEGQPGIGSAPGSRKSIISERRRLVLPLNHFFFAVHVIYQKSKRL